MGEARPNACWTRHGEGVCCWPEALVSRPPSSQMETRHSDKHHTEPVESAKACEKKPARQRRCRPVRARRRGPVCNRDRRLDADANRQCWFLIADFQCSLCVCVYVRVCVWCHYADLVQPTRPFSPCTRFLSLLVYFPFSFDLPPSTM